MSLINVNIGQVGKFSLNGHFACVSDVETFS